MHFQFKKFLFSTIFNSCLFTLLIIGLQNNVKKSSVNFINLETVKLPVGFVVGTSFIAGSIIANLFSLSFKKVKE